MKQFSKYLKSFCLSLILFIPFNFSAYSQDSLLFSSQWIKLKETMNKRTDLILVIREKLSKSGPEIKRESDSAVAKTRRLDRALIQQVAINQAAIDSVSELYTLTTTSLARTIVLLELEASKTKENILSYLTQLEGVENRIHIAIRDFDRYCLEVGRPDCCFQKATGEESAPRVRF